ASATGAAKEFVHDGLNGFLIPAGDRQKCVDPILDLHRDRDHLARLSENARQTALARPGWSDTVDAIHSFLTRFKKSTGTNPANTDRQHDDF
ncbi:MAG: hypothetical protein R3274_08550, partial [Desulfobacterales bacterium]|nr:hypothetical protein [Desulfobacterales bacterium]